MPYADEAHTEERLDAGADTGGGRDLLDSIDIESVVGQRDRALIALMVYTFARVGAVLKMRVEDFFVQGRRGWVRLHEKGGKLHEMPRTTTWTNISRPTSRRLRSATSARSRCSVRHALAPVS